MRKILTIAIVLTLALTHPLIAVAEEDEHHRHHVGVSGGIASHESKSSAFIGVDYFYRFGKRWAGGVFYEEVSGDFDLQVLGLTVGYYFDSGWTLATGAGAEYKIEKDKTLALLHISGGYNWHNGDWSIGPVATVDFIEDGNTTYYLGLSVGYGF